MADADLAVVEGEQTPTPVHGEGAAILQIIERAANSDVDIEKMERLFEMRERIELREAEKAFFAAMADMQPQLPVVEHTKKISYFSKKLDKWIDKSTYTPWEDIDEIIRPIYTSHGFSLSFDISQAAEQPTITAVVMHRDGHSVRTPIKLPLDMSGEKNAVQGLGSAITYGKRYAACAALNVTTRGADGETDDDDGEAAQPGFNSYKARKEQLWEKLSAEMHEICTTRVELRDWFERTKQHSKEWRNMPKWWRHIFINEEMAGLAEDLPGRVDS